MNSSWVKSLLVITPLSAVLTLCQLWIVAPPPPPPPTPEPTVVVTPSDGNPPPRSEPAVRGASIGPE